MFTNVAGCQNSPKNPCRLRNRNTENKHSTKLTIGLSLGFLYIKVCHQCFDTVSWAAGRASGL